MNVLFSFIVSPNRLADILETAASADFDAELSTGILQATEQRNERILAIRANHDVLEIIFFMVLDLEGSAGLRTVSQVCQKWRNVALDAPLLWSKALSLFVGPTWMFEMLRRTMDVPLNICVSGQDIHTSVVYANLLSIADFFWRFETLDIDAPYPQINEFFGFVPFDRNDAPRLRALSLCGQSWHDLRAHDEDLPTELLSLRAPNLERLSLEDCPFDWEILKSGLLHSSIRLSVLHICYSAESDAPHILSISSLLMALASITSLQELKLKNLKPINENPFIEMVTPTIMFPALRTLDLQANIGFCASFLNGVLTPILAELDVECNTMAETGDTPVFMTSALMSGISAVVSCPHDVLTVIHRNRRLWIWLRSRQTGAFCRILVRRVNDSPALKNILRRLANMPSAHGTEMLQIDLGKDVHNKVAGEVWEHLFERLNNVVFLNFGKYPVPRILQTLYRNAKGAVEAQEQGKKATVLLPLLWTITALASPNLCILADMIGELREIVGAPIDRFGTLRKTDTYLAMRDRIVAWLEGSISNVPMDNFEESTEESEDFGE